MLDLDEQAQIDAVQAGFINFYPDDAVNPYVAHRRARPVGGHAEGRASCTTPAATACSASATRPQPSRGDGQAAGDGEHDVAEPVASCASPAPCAREIGHTRGGCPYAKFLCLNSGSESVSLAGRIADVNTKLHTDAGGATPAARIKRLAVKGAFHGRTERPALYSDSSRKTYAAAPGQLPRTRPA